MNTSPDNLINALGGAEIFAAGERMLRSVPSMTASGERLVNYIERLETLAEEKTALASDMTEVFAEAKLEGFDPKVLRMLLRLRAMDDRSDFIRELNSYMYQVGMYEQLQLPLDQPAQDKVA